MELTFHIYWNCNREWRWTLYAIGDRVIAEAANGCKKRQDCLEEINLIQSAASSATVWDLSGHKPVNLRAGNLVQRQ
jgi:uncharacterized protein YegP (UPF0339 family)